MAFKFIIGDGQTLTRAAALGKLTKLHESKLVTIPQVHEDSKLLYILRGEGTNTNYVWQSQSSVYFQENYYVDGEFIERSATLMSWSALHQTTFEMQRRTTVNPDMFITIMCPFANTVSYQFLLAIEITGSSGHEEHNSYDILKTARLGPPTIEQLLRVRG